MAKKRAVACLATRGTAQGSVPIKQPDKPQGDLFQALLELERELRHQIHATPGAAKVH